MASTKATMEAIRAGRYDYTLARLYGGNAVFAQRARYVRAVERFEEIYGVTDDVRLFSAPGRTEIGGNHTDHNHGKVIAASVNLDVIAVATASDTDQVRIQSEGYRPDTIDLNDLSVNPRECNRSSALVRGVADGFCKRGYRVGGVCAYTTSNVLKGSGLSSSAAFEVLLGTIFNYMYNEAAVSAVEIAQIAQYAENAHFGKPCGLMDQMASSVGGIVAIDFHDPEQPVIQSVPYDFRRSGYALCIVDTGGSHAALTGEYAAVTQEMKAVCTALGVDYLRDTTREAVLQHIDTLRSTCGDRAVLRALHFFAENERVEQQSAALERGDFQAFLKLITASGHSSFEFLQNLYANADVTFQGLPLALAVAEHVLDGRGACRVHGGGFAGTTQNFVPLDNVAAFTEAIEAVFGAGSCHKLSIRPCGGVELVP